jgi:hypothetical protein
MEVFATALGAFAGLVLLAILLAGLFMYVGAKFAMVEKATFGRAVLAAIACTLADWALTAALSPVPLLGSCSGFIIGLAASLLIVKAVFDTTLARAFLVWVFHLLAQILALFLALLTFAGALFSYMTLPFPTS